MEHKTLPAQADPPPILWFVHATPPVQAEARSKPRRSDPNSYLREGDMDMYNEQNIAARRALRSHPAIVYAIQLFWNCLDLRKNIDGDVLRDECVPRMFHLCRRASSAHFPV